MPVWGPVSVIRAAACGVVLTSSALAATQSPIDEALAVYKTDEARAIELFTPLAEAGDVVAQNKLAHMYYWGEGTPRDHDKSHAWAMKSAAQGNAEGEADVGFDYVTGTSVSKDMALGVQWLSKAAAQGDSYAETSLASLYLQGVDVPPDNALGLDYLRRAAAGGEPRAQTLLGMALSDGSLGLKRDPPEAVRMLTLAAEQRGAAAQYVLGSLYHSGDGIRPNEVDAAKWMLLAAQGGCKRAALASAALARETWQPSLDKARRLAEEWERTHPARDPHDHRDLTFGAMCSLTPQPDRQNA